METTNIKVMSRAAGGDGARVLGRQLLGGWAESQGLSFTFEADAKDYDWLVVYENMPASAGERRPMRIEKLACPPQNTILLTTEPSAVKIYSRAYTRQFGHVVTSQEPFALRHPGRLWSQAGLRWFYGAGEHRVMTADEIAADDPIKTKTVSTVCSTKRQGHTLHRLRYDFTLYAADKITEMEVFGRGHRPLDDKAEAIDDYRYHLAVENHIAPHHFTEKLADTFLGLALPFYFGAPNAADYFPEESFIAIDIRKPDEAIAVMKEAIATNQYEKRLPAIREARRRVLEEHSLFPLIARVIASNTASDYRPDTDVLRSQRAAQKSAPITALGDLAFREALHFRNRIANAFTKSPL
ncbi:glycosyltransferase family 10 domain-containing protein [Agrobacterium sp. ES01]|uniref:glycosyltransferase family 10 domain-containing protein n=1 Tax=Agrobacterium sp. ES01 TaxID=3420714 RepID=UPI003D0FCF51